MVTKTRSAPVPLIACCNPGQVGVVAHDEAAVDAAHAPAAAQLHPAACESVGVVPKRRIHGVPCADGGASTNARLSIAASTPASVTREVGGNATPAAR